MPDFPKIYSLKIQPGIERDGTIFSRKGWQSGTWCRFYRGYPYKIGGYLQVTQDLEEICRAVLIVPGVSVGLSGTIPSYTIFLGTASTCQYFIMNQAGGVIQDLTDITPAGFVGNANNIWTFDLAPNSNPDSSGISLIAHSAPNLMAITNNVQAPVYYTDAYTPVPLVPLLAIPFGGGGEEPVTSDGGICTLFPYLFTYGSAGNLQWIDMSANPPTVDGDTSVAGLKIVAGSAVRGGNSAPSGLFWALDRLVRATFTGTGAPDLEVDFTFDTISTETSILSQKAFIEYDSIYYWVGIDRFLLYNGIVQELPNNSSLDFFFTNLNFSAKEKVFATKIPHWGEIWWFFPTLANPTPDAECDHAVIYNVREQTWYDTPITRSAGDFDQTFPNPIWTDNVPDNTGGFPIWVQEVGYDKVAGPPAMPLTSAIESFIETPIISYAGTDLENNSPEMDRWTYLYRIELDANQAGVMNLYVRGADYATDYNEPGQPNVVTAIYQFYPNTEKIDMREQRRLFSLRFESNDIGGFFEIGRILIVANPSDARQ